MLLCSFNNEYYIFDLFVCVVFCAIGQLNASEEMLESGKLPKSESDVETFLKKHTKYFLNDIIKYKSDLELYCNSSKHMNTSTCIEFGKGIKHVVDFYNDLAALAGYQVPQHEVQEFTEVVPDTNLLRSGAKRIKSKSKIYISKWEVVCKNELRKVCKQYEKAISSVVHAVNSFSKVTKPVKTKRKQTKRKTKKVKTKQYKLKQIKTKPKKKNSKNISP
jgi:hypothetical protein